MTLTKLSELHLIKIDRSTFVVIITLAKYNKDSKSFDSIQCSMEDDVFFNYNDSCRVIHSR